MSSRANGNGAGGGDAGGGAKGKAGRGGRRPPGKLTDGQKGVVVQLLAAYWTPTEVSDYVKTNFGVEITRQGVAQYDPTVIHRRPCAQKWIDLFWQTRGDYLRKRSEHAIAYLGFRLGMLQRIVERAMARGNYDLALRALEQAARDDGGSYTSRRSVQVEGNIGTGVMKVPVIDDRDLVLALIAEHQAGLLGAAGNPN